MKTFRTEIKLNKSENYINHQNKIITIGSCFSDNIGNLLKINKFNTLINPFGILYNPISIKQCIEKIIEKCNFKENDLIFYQEIWHSFYHHGKFSGENKAEVLRKINTSISESHKTLNQVDYLLVTFGSSYVYKYLENNLIVANCHKIPQKRFSQEMLKLNEIFKEWQLLIEIIKSFNPQIKIIFTVSPIRYLKYGNEMNSISKATLILLISQLKNTFDNIDYFPAYEIFMDDLRDYRFYKDDMIHPSEEGIKYVWQKFCEIYFKKETMDILEKVKSINLSLNHRPIHPQSLEHKKFINLQLEKINQINQRYPQLDFDCEKEAFLNYLTD